MKSTFCQGCNTQFRKKSNSGYCSKCFHTNVDGVKTKYSRDRWVSGVAKIQCWKHRGASITPGDMALYDSQTSCEICGKAFANDKCMDHDHSNGTYRGALCRQCNAALGKLGDDLDLAISRLVAYRDRLTG